MVKEFKKKLFDLVEAPEDNAKFDPYDWFMMIVIIVSIIPLAFNNSNQIFNIVDKVTAVIFIVDYILRLFTANLKLNKGVKSYFIYPFTPMAIIDILSILPSLTILSSSFKLLKILRLLKTLKVLKAFKIIRYSKNISIVINVFKKQKRLLSTVGIFAVGYILISALLIFNVEPESFDNFFDAVYLAAISLTTVGYGDIYPVTAIGRLMTVVSSLFGIAIIALPSGVLTAGFIDEIKENKTERR